MPSKHSLKSIRQQHKIFSTWLSVSTCPCSAAILGQTQELWEGQGGKSNCLGTASRSWPGQSRLQGTTGASSSAFSLTSPSSGDKSIPLTNCCDWGYSTVAAASLRPCISCWAQIQGQLGATALSVPVETISQPGEGWCQHPTSLLKGQVNSWSNAFTSDVHQQHLSWTGGSSEASPRTSSLCYH